MADREVEVYVQTDHQWQTETGLSPYLIAGRVEWTRVGVEVERDSWLRPIAATETEPSDDIAEAVRDLAKAMREHSQLVKDIAKAREIGF